ncbi:MAG: T9SS type A sorting domain-containing protein, partial [Lewinella sp.]|nr:T9SS type A sorting domain-containing protein [Lewinella sp.]
TGANSFAGSGYFDAWVENGVSPSGLGTNTDFVDKTWHFEPVAAFGNTLSLQIFWNGVDEQSNFDRSACWISRFDGTGWDYNFPASASNLNVFGASQYAILRSNLSNFGAFTIASDGILPVELVDFRAEATTSGHHLQWQTASELNNSHFEVQHSTDGLRFERIGEVAGQGTSEESTNYEWYYQPTSRAIQHYYRLRQIDYDGQFSFSNIVVVQALSSSQSSVQIYPNPVMDHVKILIPSEGRVIDQMFIFSIDGRRVWQQAVASGDQIDVSCSYLDAGVYLVYGGKNEQQLMLLGQFIKD